MQEPPSRSECECSTCPLFDDEDIDEESISFMRCSVCKNRFYCSAQCQKRDWKVHKWNCSALVTTGPGIEIDEEFKEELKRVSAILKDVANAVKGKNEQKAPASVIASLFQIPSELPERLRYTRAIEDSDKFKYRVPIVAACRLLLINYVPTLDDAERKKYESWFASMNMPMSFGEIYGPKILEHPAHLSPGEYQMLIQMMMVSIVVPKLEDADEENKVGEGPSKGEEEQDEPDWKPWLWLGQLRGLYFRRDVL